MSTNAQLFERAQRVIPGGVNSPVRAFRAVGGTPRFIARAQGPHFWDAEGRRYIDYIGSWGPMILGHGHPAVLEAVHRAVDVPVLAKEFVIDERQLALDQVGRGGRIGLHRDRAELGEPGGGARHDGGLSARGGREREDDEGAHDHSLG